MDEEDIIKFLEAQVKKSGFSLENSVKEILKTHYKIHREVPYFDRDELKGRSVDMVASAFIPDKSHIDNSRVWHIGQLNLVIECKNIPGNVWVFSEEPTPELGIPELVSITSSIKKDPANGFSPTWVIKEIPCVAGYDEYVFDPKKSNTRPKKEPKNLYGAIVSVTKALKDRKVQLEKLFGKLRYWSPSKQNYILHFAFFQALIIFTGKIFISRMEGSNTKFEPVKYVQMAKQYVSKDYDETLGEIHIVSFDALEEYLSLIRKYYWVGTKLIIEKQDELKKAKDSLKGL